MSSINYSEKIPNNVNLGDDRTLQRALEQWQPNFLSWWGDMGPDGSNNFDVYLRTAISVDPQGWAQFGHVKMPDYRWGIFLNPGEAEPQDPLRRPQGRGRLAGRARRTPRQPAPHHRHAGRHRAGLGRAAAPPRPDLPEPVRPAQPVPGQRRRRPPPVGDGLPAAQALRPRRPRRSRGAARAPLAATPTTRASSAPSTRRRPTGCRSSCSPTSPTATASTSSARWPKAPSTRWRARRKFMLTEEAHHMFVGESGVSRIIQRTVQRDERAQDRRRRPTARRRRHRPADDPALHQLPLQRHGRPVRRRPVEQCRHLLQLGPEGPLRGRQARRRPRAQGPDLQGARSARRPADREGGADAQRAQRGAARRLHQGLGGRRESLEQGDREGRHRAQAARAAQGLPPQHRRAVGRQGVTRRPRRRATPNGRPRSTSGCRPARTAPTSHH